MEEGSGGACRNSGDTDGGGVGGVCGVDGGEVMMVGIESGESDRESCSSVMADSG